MTKADTRLQEVIQEHFEPKWGSPYWLERLVDLNFNPLEDVRTVDDLHRFGITHADGMSTRPVEDFIPRKYHDRLHAFVVSETGGTSGPPKRTAYLANEFVEAFVDPFVAAANLVKFPHKLHWLYIGPSGPHIIGKAARACAEALNSMDPFTVDFDPRWVRKFSAGSMAHSRYLEHVLTQAESVLVSQSVGVLFATPPIITTLGQRLPEEIRLNVRGVHLGGLPADAEFLGAVKADWFPNAVVLGGYGNSLAGLCPQLATSDAGAPEYFPHGCRLLVDVVHKADGSRGRVVFHRLDRSCFLPNMYERDEAERIELSPDSYGSGFQRYGLRDPRPAMSRQRENSAALY